MTTTDYTIRNGELGSLVEMLRQHRDYRYDVVAPASEIRYEAGDLVLLGAEGIIDETGVSRADVVLDPSDIFESGIAEKLGIPRAYLRRMRDESPTVDPVSDDDGTAPVMLLDHNVNAWLGATPGKRFLVRAFRDPDRPTVGTARAFLSDSYRPVDNLDVLMAVLDGIRETGTPIEVKGCDLTERRMRVRIDAPEITAMAPKLLAGYRSPYAGTRHGGEAANTLPLVSAGLEVSNSETGGGAATITPRITVLICDNGATFTSDALRHVHLGSKLDVGVIRWSDDTQRKNLELVTAQARDAVASYLSTDYVEAKVREMEEVAGVEVSEPRRVIETVCASFGYSDEDQDRILDAFLSSGQRTAGGVMQAVTATAQRVEDPETAAGMEAAAVEVLALAAREAVRS